MTNWRRPSHDAIRCGVAHVGRHAAALNKVERASLPAGTMKSPQGADKLKPENLFRDEAIRRPRVRSTARPRAPRALEMKGCPPSSDPGEHALALEPAEFGADN